MWTFYLLCSCDFDLDPMTFIYERDPYSLEITGCTIVHYMNFLRQGCRKLSSDRETDTHDQNKKKYKIAF